MLLHALGDYLKPHPHPPRHPIPLRIGPKIPDRFYQQLRIVCHGCFYEIEHAHGRQHESVKLLFRQLQSCSKRRTYLNGSIKCRKAAELILPSPSRAMPTRVLQQKLNFPDNTSDINILVQKGVLILREVSYLSSDLPKEVYGPLREQIACMPSKLHEKVWEEVLAAE